MLTPCFATRSRTCGRGIVAEVGHVEMRDAGIAPFGLPGGQHIISTQAKPSSAAKARTSSSYRSPRLPRRNRVACTTWGLLTGQFFVMGESFPGEPSLYLFLPISSLDSPTATVDTYGCGRLRQHDRAGNKFKKSLRIVRRPTCDT